jgi:hypothetical protein
VRREKHGRGVRDGSLRPRQGRQCGVRDWRRDGRVGGGGGVGALHVGHELRRSEQVVGRLSHGGLEAKEEGRGEGGGGGEGERTGGEGKKEEGKGRGEVRRRQTSETSGAAHLA